MLNKQGTQGTEPWIGDTPYPTPYTVQIPYTLHLHRVIAPYTLVSYPCTARVGEGGGTEGCHAMLTSS